MLDPVVVVCCMLLFFGLGNLVGTPLSLQAHAFRAHTVIYENQQAIPLEFFLTLC